MATCRQYEQIDSKISLLYKDGAEHHEHDHDSIRSSSIDSTGESTIRRAIEQAASRHLDLLTEVQRSEASACIAENHRVILQHVTRDLEVQSKIVRKAADLTSRLQDKHGSKRRFSVKGSTPVTRSLQSTARSHEAEQAYHDALLARSQAEQRELALQQDMVTAQRELDAVSGDAQKHDTAQKQLDSLYAGIFVGNTPEFPEEDEAESCFDTAAKMHATNMAMLEGLRSAAKAHSRLASTLPKIRRHISDMAEHELSSSWGANNASVSVERSAVELDESLESSQKSMPELDEHADVGLGHVHRKFIGHLSDARAMTHHGRKKPYAFSSRRIGHEAVQGVMQALDLAAEACAEVVDLLKKEEQEARRAAIISSRSLSDARQSLQDVRQSIFEQVVGYGVAAPPYKEHCGRAESFCSDRNSMEVLSSRSSSVSSSSSSSTDGFDMTLPPSYEAIMGCR